VTPPNVLPALQPASNTFLSGGYRTGKTTLAKALIRTIGGGIIFAAPEQEGARVEYSDMALVVHDLRSLDRASRKAPYVVWPSPPLSDGQDAVREAYNEFCGFAMSLRKKAVVSDEFQRITEDRKQLSYLPPNCRSLTELGHKEPSYLAKIWVAHRLAQIPLVYGEGAVRISTRPFPGDDAALEPFFGKEGYARMRLFRQGDFAFWSDETGARMPLRLKLAKTNAGGGKPLPAGG
jgi:hypothetical protein